MMKNVINKTHHKMLLLFFGLIMFLCFLYVRFLGQRLPRDIPFSLTEFNFITLLFLCFGFCYAIKSLIKPKNTSITFLKLLQYSLIPFIMLDKYIKNNTGISVHYKKFLKILLPKIFSFSSLDRVILIYLARLIPSYILLFIFLLDVFYLQKIEIFYYFLFVGIIPLIYSYYKYSLKSLKEEYLNNLDTRYDLVMMIDDNILLRYNEKKNPTAFYHNKDVSLKEYFNIQLENYYAESIGEQSVEYHGSPYSREEYYKQYRILHNKITVDLNQEDYDQLNKYFHDIEPILRELMIYIDLNKYTYEFYYIKQLRILLYLLYLIGWLYILLKSFHTLEDIPITMKIIALLTKYTQNLNPFTNP